MNELDIQHWNNDFLITLRYLYNLQFTLRYLYNLQFLLKSSSMKLVL